MEEKLETLEITVPKEVVGLLGEESEREAFEALLLHLIRTDRVSVAWAGGKLGLGRMEAIKWYTSHGYPYPDYSEEDLDEDFRHVERMRKLREASRPPK